MNPNLPPFLQNRNQFDLSQSNSSNLGIAANAQIAPQVGGQTDSQKLNSILGFALPTVGAIGGEVLGGPIGAGLGAGGAQAILDLLQGKKPGLDTVTTGGLTLAGGALGKLLPGVTGKLLSGAGEDLATGGLNLTKSVANGLKAKNGESVLQTLTKNGLAGSDASGIQDSLQNYYKFHGQIADQIPLDFDTFAKNADATLQDIKSNAAYGPDSSLYKGVNSKIQTVLGQMNDGKFNLNDQLGNFDKATADTQFNPDSEAGVNRTMGNILRQSMYDKADSMGITGPDGQSWQQFGLNLRNLQNISDAAGKREGMGETVFGLKNLLRTDVGFNFGGLGVGVATGWPITKSLIRQSPQLAGVLSKGLAGAGSAVSRTAPLAGILGEVTGANAGNGISGTTTPSIATPAISGPENNNQNNNGSQSQNNSPALGGNIAQTGSNSNNQVIKLSSSNQTLPATLPNADQLGNSIPGQVYPISQYMSDVGKADQIIANNPTNPLAFQLADQLRSQAQAKMDANNQVVSVNLQQLGLSPTQSQFILSAAPTWQTLGALQQSIQANGGKDLFQTILASGGPNSIVNQLRAKADNTGQYGHMLQLMQTASAEVAKMNAGASPTDFQVSLEQAFSPSNNVATNLANLDQSMTQMYKQYQQYAPFFHMQLNAPNNQQQGVNQVMGGQGGGGVQTSSGLLNNLLSKASV